MSKVRACEPSSCPARAEKVGHALDMSALRSFRRLRDLKRAGWKELLDRAGAGDRTHLLLPASKAPSVWIVPRPIVSVRTRSEFQPRCSARHFSKASVPSMLGPPSFGGSQ